MNLSICDLSRFWFSCLGGFIAPKSVNYFAFQSFDFERTWWRFFQKRVVRTKFGIYVFIYLRKNVIIGNLPSISKKEKDKTW